MVRNRRIILSCILFICAGLLQWKVGNINFSYFAFPVNVALLFSLLGVNYVIYQEKREHKIVQALMSSTTSVALIALTFIGAMVIALAPQWDFQRSWPFNLILLLLLCNLQLTVMRYQGRHRKRFYLTHVGLYLFIVGLSFGAPDTQKSRAILYEGQTVERAYNHSGDLCAIGFPLTLEKFEVDYYENQVPRSFKATIMADNERHEIQVNHPWQRSWKEDIYLVSHGTDSRTQQPYCVLEFITQPWKYLVHFGVLLTAIGAFMLLWGKKNNQEKI